MYTQTQFRIMLPADMRPSISAARNVGASRIADECGNGSYVQFMFHGLTDIEALCLVQAVA